MTDIHKSLDEVDHMLSSYEHDLGTTNSSDVTNNNWADTVLSHNLGHDAILNYQKMVSCFPFFWISRELFAAVRKWYNFNMAELMNEEFEHLYIQLFPWRGEVIISRFLFITVSLNGISQNWVLAYYHFKIWISLQLLDQLIFGNSSCLLHTLILLLHFKWNFKVYFSKVQDCWTRGHLLLCQK